MSAETEGLHSEIGSKGFRESMGTEPMGLIGGLLKN